MLFRPFETTNAKRVFVAGAGHSGFMVWGFAIRLIHMGIQTYVVGESTTPAIRAEDALIIASGSGETGSLVSMAGKAKKIGSKLGLVTIFADSMIGRAAEAVVAISAPTPRGTDNGPISVQPMGSLFEQSMLLTFDTVIMLLMDKRGLSSDEMFKKTCQSGIGGSMKAAVIYGKDDIRFVDWLMPETGSGDVLIRVRACGICGSDVPRVNEGTAHPFPLILWHEFSSDVVRVSKNVTKVQMGDKVTGAGLLDRGTVIPPNCLSGIRLPECLP